MTELFNENPSDCDERTFSQYQLYVESADRISANRLTVFNIFVTLNAGVFAGLIAVLRDRPKLIAFSGLGIFLSVLAIWILHLYQSLNQQKYCQILEIEKRLPVNLFGYEWQELQKNRHVGFVQVEKGFFAAMGLIYLLLIIFSRYLETLELV